ncbi:two-component regulator propeller domain-containing protein [Pedobacter ginsengisoli]|nr:two-component regulator propeller domain-containing protein [Pedobacter ginsengisoli]
MRLLHFFIVLIWMEVQFLPVQAQLSSGGSNEQSLYGSYALKTYTIADGLPSKNTTATLKDRRGFIWIGTENGLCRFDGYTFKVFYHKEGDDTSISNNYVNTIVEDHQGKLWVGTMDGLNLLDPLTEKFQNFYHDEKVVSSISNNKIWSLLCDREGTVWIGTDDGFNRFLEQTKSFTTYQPNQGVPGAMVGKSVNAIVEDKHGSLWLGNWSGGLNRFDKRTARFINFQQTQLPGLKNPNDIWSLAYDENGVIWVGTYWNGLFKFDPGKSNFTPVQVPDKTNTGVYSILPVQKNRLIVGGNNGFYWLNTENYSWEPIKDVANYPFGNCYMDHNGIIWINARNGVLKIDRQQYKFDLTELELENYEVNSVVSKDSILWIGTNKGLFTLNYKSGKLSGIKKSAQTNGLKSNDISKLYFDSKGILWILTENGFDSYDKERNLFVHHNHRSSLGSLFNEDVFRDILEVDPGIYYLATDAGLKVYNSHSNTFKHYFNKKNDKYSLSNNHLYSLLKDKKGNIWIGTYGGGVNIFDRKSERFRVIRSAEHSGAGISSNIIRNLYQDSNDNIWITTPDGLNKYIAKDQRFVVYSKKDGFFNNVFKDITEDIKGNIWVTTESGISTFDPKHISVRNFDEADGVSVNTVMLNNGQNIFLTGNKGIIKFDPLAIYSNKTIPAVYFTDFQLFNKSVFPSANGPLKENLNVLKELTLNYEQSVFSFEFVGLNYIYPEKNKYAYILIGFDKKWNYVGTQRKATYTNLNPGTYKLWIRASNNDGVWNNKGRVLVIHINPPWYWTWWAYLLYALVFCLAIYGYILYRNKQEDLKYKIKVANIESEKEKELNEKKLSFFTNISHEFRTPLTLIINPIKELLYHDDKNVDTSNLNIVYRNAKRLLSLVDQLLLFRKADTQADKLKAADLDIVNLCKEVYLCFSHQARSRKINYEFLSSQDHIQIYADREKLEIAIFNLLSNAIKFTPDEGYVSLEVSETLGTVNIQVKDSGSGIPENSGQKIYSRFYQEPDHNNSLRTGFGIGLYLVKNFVEIHGGTISYKSSQNKGTSFFITLLKGKSHLDTDQILPGSDASSLLLMELAEDEESLVNRNEKTTVEEYDRALALEKKSLIIIDDNKSIRDYLVEVFKVQYHLYVAASGEEGMRMIREFLPDFIISDVMMQGISGIEICSLVKEDASLCHIPIVLLTASSSPEIKLKGIEIGADDYISKPFDKDLLVARVAGILKSKSSLQQYFYNEVTLNPNNFRISAEYRDFLQDCIRIVEKHITDPNFSIQILADEIGMSRSNLFNKIKSISGRSSNSFIRFIRLRKAAEIFINTDNTISETMFMVGMNDIKYFREQFNKLFNMNPSDYIKKYRKNFSNNITLNKDVVKK